MEYDVYGIGNPLMDMVFFVNDNDLKSLGLRKGSMNLVDENKREQILRHLHGRKHETFPAGDCPNTMRGIAALGGKAVFSGKVGSDETASEYIQALKKQGVVSDIFSEDGITGTSIIMVTPDSERTMATFLGNCRLYSKEDVNPDMLKNSKYLYFTGYLWDTESQKEAAKHAVSLAQKSGVKIVFNLADHFACETNRKEFLSLINDVDIVIANEKEAKVLAGDNHIQLRRGRCSVVAITLGEKGSRIYHKDRIHDVPAFRVDPVDTTGAGDMYAAGLLYGLSRSLDIPRAAAIGSYLASRIVSQIGTSIPATISDEIRRQIG